MCRADKAGEVVEVNSALEDAPEIVNERPYDAWFFKVKRSNLEADLAALVAPAEYGKFIEELEWLALSYQIKASD